MDSTTTTEIRRNNLRLLLREAGGADQIARRLNFSKNELFQLTNLNDRCEISSWLARDIENKLGLEEGWLDIQHEYLPHEARQIAQKWLILPSNIQDQIKDYIDLQIQSLRNDIKSEPDDEDITDMSKILDQQTN